MRPEESPYVDLCPSLDLIRSRPLDAPHSEWRGLGRILQALLIQEVLTKAGASAYLQAFQKFPFRHNWPRIQSPLYIWSWSLSEAGRATLLTPLILRCKSRTGWFRLRFVQEFARLNEDANDNQSIIESIIRAYAILAMVNSVTGSQVYTPPETLHNRILKARSAYQRLLQAAHNAQGRSRPADSDAENEEPLDDIGKGLPSRSRQSLRSI